VSHRGHGNVPASVRTKALGELKLKGFQRPVLVHAVLGLAEPAPRSAG